MSRLQPSLENEKTLWCLLHNYILPLITFYCRASAFEAWVIDFTHIFTPSLFLSVQYPEQFLRITSSRPCFSDLLHISSLRRVRYIAIPRYMLHSPVASRILTVSGDPRPIYPKGSSPPGLGILPRAVSWKRFTQP
jgi:hypothetical protein